MTMFPFLTAYKDSEPETLLDLCFKYIVRHLDALCTIDPFTKDLKLREGLYLPNEICEKILEVYQQSGHVLDDKFVNIFQNPHSTRLKRVRLRNSTITDDGLCTLLNHKLVELDLFNCTNITEGSLVHINEFGDSLLSLCLGSSVHVLPDLLFPEDCQKLHDGSVVSAYHKRGYVLRAPNLRKLAVKNLYVPGEKLYFPLLLHPLTNLAHLDLSNCFDLGDLSYLCELKNLVSLVLYNVQRLQIAFDSICKLKTLR